MNAKIIYGTAWKKERTTALVIAAALQGFRAIDTACQLKHYREDLVGEALNTLYEQHGFKREDFFLQTKFTSLDGQDVSGFLPYDPEASVTNQVKSSFQTSLKQLQTTYLDSYVLHSPLRTFPQTLEAWHVLASLQDEGKVRKIGLSNAYDVNLIERLGLESGRKVQVVQNRWFEGNGWDKAVVAWCKENEAQYQSFWTLTGSPSLLRHPELQALARNKGCTPAQALYRFAQTQGITPLTGTTSEEHMKEDLAVENIDPSTTEVQTLVRYIWA